MNEARAREATLLQAFETALPASPSWSDDDRRWASRLALQDTVAATTSDDFIACRTRHAMQRLAPREPALAHALARRLWRLRWVGAVVAAAFTVGVLADSIGSSQRINLLAPPLWGVVGWNLVVYGLLLGHAFAHAFRRGPAAPGVLSRFAQRVGRRLSGSASAGSMGGVAGGSAKAMQVFASLWSQRSAGLAALRGATLLHAAAAALALGLIAGLYARGLVLDYRAAWESTFLSAGSAQALLSMLLGPASAWSGIALPDAAGFAALRAAHGDAAIGAPAGPWIHLWALTLLLAVVLPRSGLAAWGALRARHLARQLALPLGEPYFQALLRERHGNVANVHVLPYAQTPAPQAVLGLRALLAAALGDGLTLQVSPTLAFGAEDEAAAWPVLAADTTLAVALFDMAATPEAENHGAFIRGLAQRTPPGVTTLALIDEASFAARFQGDAVRLEQRRAAWRALLGSLHCALAFADLQSTDTGPAQRELRATLGLPGALP